MNKTREGFSEDLISPVKELYENRFKTYVFFLITGEAFDCINIALKVDKETFNQVLEKKAMNEKGVLEIGKNGKIQKIDIDALHIPQ